MSKLAFVFPFFSNEFSLRVKVEEDSVVAAPSLDIEADADKVLDSLSNLVIASSCYVLMPLFLKEFS